MTPCVIIHSSLKLSFTTTTHIRHNVVHIFLTFFSFYFILPEPRATSEHRKKLFSSLPLYFFFLLHFQRDCCCCCCSKSVVFKMEFHVSDCGIPFHYRVTHGQFFYYFSRSLASHVCEYLSMSGYGSYRDQILKTKKN